MKDFIQKSGKFLTPNYRRQPIALTHGKGMKVWDSNGKEYLDFVAGIATVNLGHAHPAVSKAICEQSRKLVHTSNLYHIQPQIELAELLVKHSALDQAFFCNSGTEANEAAIKLARKYSHEKSKRGPRIIAAKNSFHGRTYGGLSATGQEKFKTGFEPLLPGFDFVEFGDSGALEKAVDENTCAVMLEVVQAEGGINIPHKDYFPAVRRICDNHNLLLILDEVQTGMGRLGKLFGYEWAGVKPDIITLAKALGNGVPIGAMLARKEVAEVLTPGSHASTFGGNFIASAAALATAKEIIRKKLYKRAEKIGEYFMDRLDELAESHPSIKEVRGVGLMIGAELAIDKCERVVDAMRDAGFLVNVTQGKVLRFVPPLIVSTKEIDKLVSMLDKVLAKFDGEVR
jgi:predicted acetylornithine/succinylornithine family transaminase